MYHTPCCNRKVAQIIYSCFHLSQPGLPVNLQQAEELYQRASRNGFHEATARLTKLREKQTAAHEQSQQQQLLSKRTKKSSTIKRSKTGLEKSIHTSASEPALGTKVADSKVAIPQNTKTASIIDQLSYLSLFIPYFFSMGDKFSASQDGTGDARNKKPVVFHVGEEINDAEIGTGYEQGDLKAVSRNMNGRMSSLLTVV